MLHSYNNAGDTAAANAALEASQSALSKQGLYARAVANQASTPEVKNAILKDAANAEKLAPELQSAARAAIAKPSDAAAQQKLAAVASKTKDVNKNLAAHGRVAVQQRLARYLHILHKNTTNTNTTQINTHIHKHTIQHTHSQNFRERQAQKEREEKARKLLEEESVETVSLVLAERTENLKVQEVGTTQPTQYRHNTNRRNRLGMTKKGNT
jgi:hypothetical protein